MSSYKPILRLLTRPQHIPNPPYLPPSQRMTLETAEAKHQLAQAFLPAVSPDDSAFRTYLLDFTAYQLAVVRRRIEAQRLGLQLELPLTYEDWTHESDNLFPA